MRLMMVTHDAERRRCLTEFLGAQGYDLIVPPHRQDAVPMAKQTKPDAIVLDLYVVDPNGADLLCELRADGYTGKVVALSGIASRATLSKCWREGVDHVVGGIHTTNGPIDPGQVEAAIRAVFRGGHYSTRVSSLDATRATGGTGSTALGSSGTRHLRRTRSQPYPF